MAPSDFTSAEPIRQPAAFPDLAEEREILDSVNLDLLIEAVSKPYAGRGRRAFDRRAIVRAHFMAYLHKTVIGTITALHWTLMNNPRFQGCVRLQWQGSVPDQRSPGYSRRCRSIPISWSG